jgi:hypothetical protein
MRGRPLQVGDTVLFRLFNTPDKHFYGPIYEGKLVDTRYVNYSEGYFRTEYKIECEKLRYWNVPSSGFIWVRRKEIIKILDK